MSRWLSPAVLAGLLLTAAGCGGSGGKQHEVTGFVKYNGEDVVEGSIIFYPEDKSVGPEGGPIKDGTYTIKKAREGKNKVQITATRVAPGKKDPMGGDFIEQYIPKKYNEETTLTADVSSGNTKHDFDLKK